MCGAAPESEQLCACGLVNSPIVLLRLANCAPSASPDVLQRRHGDRNLVANSCITAIACAHSHVPAEAARAPKSCALAWHQRQAEQRPGGCMSPNVSACRQMTLFSPETRARNGRSNSDRSRGATWQVGCSEHQGGQAALLSTRAPVRYVGWRQRRFDCEWARQHTRVASLQPRARHRCYAQRRHSPCSS